MHVSNLNDDQLLKIEGEILQKTLSLVPAEKVMKVFFVTIARLATQGQALITSVRFVLNLKPTFGDFKNI